MNLEDQVCSLELAKKLRDLGVKQESLFFYYYHGGAKEIRIATQLTLNGMANVTKHASAFTVAELFDLLPEFHTPYRLMFGIEFKHLRETMGGKYYCTCDRADYPHDEDFYDDNFANVLAQMIIHLIEYKLMEVPK